jgi:DNA-directed RNA polymerase specialized sigma24 family protein
VVSKAIERLPLLLKEAFTFCVIEGRTQPEAAEAFRVSLGTINGRVERAKVSIRLDLHLSGEECVRDFLSEFARGT